MFPHTDIYAITDSTQSNGRSSVEVAHLMMQAGIKILQYREKHKSSGAMLEECLAIRAITTEAGCCFIVNDHVDIALLAKADGIHIGQEDLPLASVRSLVGTQCVIGVSTKNMAEYEAARVGGADYIGVGPIFATPSKKDALPMETGYLEKIAAIATMPVVAIGGINTETIASVARHSIHCFAIISAITRAVDIPTQVAALRKKIGEHL